jgi:prophage regulatory protein
MSSQPSEPLRILRFAEVSYRTGLRRSSLYQRIREGSFPKPVRITPYAVGWRSNEIEAWIQSREPVEGVPSGVSAKRAVS